MDSNGEAGDGTRYAFPPIRPDVEIVESADEIGEIDCAELRWWFAIPWPGDHTTWATYDAKNAGVEHCNGHGRDEAHERPRD